MDAALIAVGSELLDSGRVDTNTPWIARRLERAGGRVTLRAAVRDDPESLAELLRSARRAANLVVLTGGLGPTEDDRTREALVAVSGFPLRQDPAAHAAIVEKFRAFGRTPRPEQSRQAWLPEGAEALANPVGIAPGIWLEDGLGIVLALPGVPAEMTAIWEESVEPRLERRIATPRRGRVLRVAGRTESSVDAAIRDLYGTEGAEITILASTGGIELVLRVTGTDAARATAVLDGLDREIEGRLGEDLFGRDDEDLPRVVGRMLSEAGQTLATAESCTAGLLAGAVTRVPGSSGWYRGGVVAYADDLKISLAGVDAALLERHGAVSREVAAALAVGVRGRTGADWGVGVTGIAGPTGASADKPVGLVWLGLASRSGETTRRLRLPGDRDQVRARSVTAALDLVRRSVRGAR